MGRASYGVTGIKLDGKDEVVSLEVVNSAQDTILTVTRDGYGKRSLIEDYRLTGRACKGVINLNVTDKTRNVVSTIEVVDEDKFIVSTKKGIVIKTNVNNIRVMGRATQGVRLINIGEDDEIASITLSEKAEPEVDENAETIVDASNEAVEGSTEIATPSNDFEETNDEASTDNEEEN
jgi:DNA gyrase subunit A